MNTKLDRINDYLSKAKSELEITDEEIGFWEVSDYGIYVLLTERFYKTLNFRRADPMEFLVKLKNCDLPHANSYSDSRSYMKLIIDHLSKYNLNPNIFDVGGYIGRFSLEAALLNQERGDNIPIHCLEPGLTSNVIKANFELNNVSQHITVREAAASDIDGAADYKYAPDVLISGRICSFPSATKHTTVKTVRLDTLIKDIGNVEAAIIKIDTEGHEPNVMAGLGSLVKELPNVCIVEFWPATLKESVNNISYADYIEENYLVLNIRSSLYPKYYTLIEDIRKFGADFNVKDGNIDLLFVSRSVPNCQDLISKLITLA